MRALCNCQRDEQHYVTLTTPLTPRKSAPLAIQNPLCIRYAGTGTNGTPCAQNNRHHQNCAIHSILHIVSLLAAGSALCKSGVTPVARTNPAGNSAPATDPPLSKPMLEMPDRCGYYKPLLRDQPTINPLIANCPAFLDTKTRYGTPSTVKSVLLYSRVHGRKTMHWQPLRCITA